MCQNVDDLIIVNGAGPVGLLYSVALLDSTTLLGLPKPKVQIWDPAIRPWRETLIRLPYTIAAQLSEEIQLELWGETSSAPQRLFVPGPSLMSSVVENCRVHNPHAVPSSQYIPVVQIKQFQESVMKYLMKHHSQHCIFKQGVCPPEVLRTASCIIQSYGAAARKANRISGNSASEEEPLIGTHVPCEHGLFVLFDREDVLQGDQDPEFAKFNQKGNGFSASQSYSKSNPVQVYIWPENVTNDTGSWAMPMAHDDLLNNGRSFGLKSLFDCVHKLQGSENWWWEFSRRCRLQDDQCMPLSREQSCTLEWRSGHPGWSHEYAGKGAKASSAGFEAWFDAVRFQISLNLYKMGIFGSRAEKFLNKVRLCYARRHLYRYGSVCTEVEGIPVIYLGDSAGSTDFKQGLSCGRGLLCAVELAYNTLVHLADQTRLSQHQISWKAACQFGAQKYQEIWSSPDMVSEWRSDYDGSWKYLQNGRMMVHAGFPQNGSFPSVRLGELAYMKCEHASYPISALCLPTACVGA